MQPETRKLLTSLLLRNRRERGGGDAAEERRRRSGGEAAAVQAQPTLGGGEAAAVNSQPTRERRQWQRGINAREATQGVGQGLLATDERVGGNGRERKEAG